MKNIFLIFLLSFTLVSCVEEIPVDQIEQESFNEGNISMPVPMPMPMPTPIPKDTTAPKIITLLPSGLQPASTLNVILQVRTDESAKCAYDLSDKIQSLMLNNLPSADGINHIRSFDVVNDMTYRFYVRCTDLAGNEVAQGSMLSFSVDKKGVEDKAPPVISGIAPSGTLAAGSKNATLLLSSSEKSICKYSVNAVTSYDLMNGMSSADGLNHSVLVSGLVDEGKYQYFFFCKDLAGNLSNKASTSFEVQAPKPIDLNLTARAILKDSCLKCHGGEITYKGLDITSDAILFDKVQRFIVKGEPSQSKIYQSLDGSGGISAMPPVDMLTIDEKNIIRDWIAAMPKDIVEPDQVICKEDADLKASLTRRLTRKEIELSFTDLLGGNFVPDLSGISKDGKNIYGISRDGSKIGLDKIEVAEYLNTTEKTIDAFIQAKSHGLFSCANLSGASLNTCLDKELLSLVYRAWRRPVDNATKAQFYGFFTGKSFDQGLKYALSVMLLSPKFFYLSYDDDNMNRLLNSFEIAERLSFLVWARVPSVELLEVARTKNLADKAVLLTEFRKLMDLDNDRSNAVNRNLDRDKSWYFYLELQDQWLKLEELSKLDFTPAGAGGTLEWATMFYIEEMFRNNKTVKDLMTSEFAVVNKSTAPLYGVDFNNSTEGDYDVYHSPQVFRKISLAGTGRKGLLNQVGILAVNSGSKEGGEVNPTHRGLWHAQNILCDLPDAIPSAIVLTDELKSNNVSLKEKFAIHTKSPACASCHVVMDPVGFGLWEYDELGAIREKDKRGFAIDPSGTLYQQFFNTADELIDIIAENQKTESCVMTHLATFSVGREINAENSCTTQTILKEVKAKNGGLMDMLEGIITSDLFIKRQKK